MVISDPKFSDVPPVRPIWAAGTPRSLASFKKLSTSSFATTARKRPPDSLNIEMWSQWSRIWAPKPLSIAISAAATARPPSPMSCIASSCCFWTDSATNWLVRTACSRSNVGKVPSLQPPIYQAHWLPARETLVSGICPSTSNEASGGKPIDGGGVDSDGCIPMTPTTGVGAISTALVSL